jgi:hypothetical protein
LVLNCPEWYAVRFREGQCGDCRATAQPEPNLLVVGRGLVPKLFQNSFSISFSQASDWQNATIFPKSRNLCQSAGGTCRSTWKSPLFLLSADSMFCLKVHFHGRTNPPYSLPYRPPYCTSGTNLSYGGQPDAFKNRTRRTKRVPYRVQ